MIKILRTCLKFCQKHKAILILLTILALATFFRLWQLNSIPAGLYPDEAINGNQAIAGPGKIFYPENNGREGLFINLISLSFNIFGVSVWSLRVVSAIIGIFTVLGLYLLTKELFQVSGFGFQVSRTIALFSSFFLAISFWHVNFSRIGFRAIMVPFILVFAFYFLFRGFQSGINSRTAGSRKEFLNFIIAGLIFGLGFYTYTAFRLSVLLLPVVFLIWWVIYKEKKLSKKFLFFIFYFLFFIFIVSLPLGSYFLNNPADFAGRLAPISVFSQPNPLLAFGKSLISHLAMFNFVGDHNWRHNISGSPILFWPVGILFLIGFFISVKEVISSAKKRRGKNVSCFMFHVLCFMFCWWLVMLLPGILTCEAIPHSLRCIGAIPPTFIFAGLGAEFLGRKIYGERVSAGLRRPILRYFIISTVVLLFSVFIFAQYHRYFISWAKNPEVENAFSKDYVEIGNYLNSLPADVRKYVIVNQDGVLVDGIPMPAQTIMFIERIKHKNPQAIYLLPDDLDKIKAERDTVIAAMGYDEGLFSELQQRFPQGEIREEDGIWIFSIETY